MGTGNKTTGVSVGGSSVVASFKKQLVTGKFSGMLAFLAGMMLFGTVVYCLSNLGDKVPVIEAVTFSGLLSVAYIVVKIFELVTDGSAPLAKLLKQHLKIENPIEGATEKSIAKALEEVEKELAR